jgi:capsid assembly protease
MMRNLHHLAIRIFDTPLLITPQKLEVILGALGARLGIEATAPLDAAAGARRSEFKPYRQTSDGIAIISIAGTLVNKAYGLDAASGLRSYVDIQREFEDAVADPRMKAILLEVDSPGGEVAGAFDLADAIYNARHRKPVYAVADNDAYSAAYLLASSAARLYVTRTSGAGSVGVIASLLPGAPQPQVPGVGRPALPADGGHVGVGLVARAAVIRRAALTAAGARIR